MARLASERKKRNAQSRRAEGFACQVRLLKIPWQLRYHRAWYLRQARWHEMRAADPMVRYRRWHMEQAADCRATIPRLMARYYENGSYDALMVASYAECMHRMRDSRWRNAMDVINCSHCFDVNVQQCEFCRHSYVDPDRA